MTRTTRKMLQVALDAINRQSKGTYRLGGYQPGPRALYCLQLVDDPKSGGVVDVSHWLEAGSMYSLLWGILDYLETEKKAGEA